MSNKINFTKQAIDNLVWSKTHSTYYYDNKIPHHRIVITKAGHKSFQVYMRYNGKPTKRKIGAYPDISPELARDMARKIISELVMGVDRFVEKKRLQNEPTYNDIWKEYFAYLVDKANQKPKTADKNIRQHISHYDQYKEFHNLRLSEITSEKIKKYHRHYSIHLGRKVMANNIIRQIRACFNYANVEINPASKIKLNKQYRREKFLNPHEMKAFINALSVDQSEDFKDIFLLCLFTASRVGAVMSMEWKELDLKHGVWHPVTKSSGNKKNVTPIGLIGKAVDILRRRKLDEMHHNKWVFPAKSKSGHITQPQKAFQRIMARANLTGFVPHDLRHTAVTWFADSSASDRELLALMGNKSISTINTYNHQNVVLVAERYGNVIDRLFANLDPETKQLMEK